MKRKREESKVAMAEESEMFDIDLEGGIKLWRYR